MTAAERGAPLTEEELGRIATEHVPDQSDCLDTAFCQFCDVLWPCIIARLYALVVRQSAILVSEGYSCVCEGHQ